MNYQGSVSSGDVDVRNLGTLLVFFSMTEG